MKNFLMACVFIIMLTTFCFSQENTILEKPVEFSTGRLKHKDLNSNFNLLMKYIDNLQNEINTLKKKKEIPIGTIISSMLSPELFRSKYGDNWVLADGRAVYDSIYHKIMGNSKIPDFRGMFIRGVNGGRVDGDPEKILDTKTNVLRERYAGERQEDQFKKHSHKVRNDYRENQGQGRRLTYGDHGGSGPHGTLSFEAGSEETRPKNIAVYFYIKIN